MRSDASSGWRTRVAGLCLILTAAILPACEWSGTLGTAGRPQPEHPIVLVGLDGFEWSVVLPMLRQGRLRNLAALMERGVYGELRSMIPTSSPIIWTSISTGYRKKRHGITGFKTSRSGRLMISSDRRVKAFWNILTDHGLRVATVGWWLTWPVEPVNGVMVAQVNTVVPRVGVAKGSLLDGIPYQVYPGERQDDILKVISEVDADPQSLATRTVGATQEPTPGSVPARLWEESAWAVRADAIYHRVGVKILEEETPFDLFAIYFGGPDVIGHRFWRYMRPEEFTNRPSDAEIAAFGDYIPAYYDYIDGVIGDLLAAAPRDAVVLVVSDHGMTASQTDLKFAADEPSSRLVSGDHTDAPPSFFVAAGPNIRRMGGAPEDRAALEQLGSVLDVTPTLCALLDLPVARDFEGRVMSEVLESSYLASHPLRTVDTYTPPDWFAHRSKPEVERFSGLEEEREKQLRTLGYIE